MSSFMKKLKKFLIVLVVIITVTLLLKKLNIISFGFLKDIESFVALILKLRAILLPYFGQIFLLGVILFVSGLYLTTLDKDYEKKEIVKFNRSHILNLFPNAMKFDSKIKTEPWATYLVIIGIVISVFVTFLVFSPDIFQSEI